MCEFFPQKSVQSHLKQTVLKVNASVGLKKQFREDFPAVFCNLGRSEYLCIKSLSESFCKPTHFILLRLGI